LQPGRLIGFQIVGDGRGRVEKLVLQGCVPNRTRDALQQQSQEYMPSSHFFVVIPTNKWSKGHLARVRQGGKGRGRRATSYWIGHVPKLVKFLQTTKHYLKILPPPFCRACQDLSSDPLPQTRSHTRFPSLWFRFVTEAILQGCRVKKKCGGRQQGASPACYMDGSKIMDGSWGLRDLWMAAGACVLKTSTFEQCILFKRVDWLEGR
jgi:hypothetical protein